MYEGNINHGHYVGSLRLCEADIEPRFHAAAKPETPPRIRGTPPVITSYSRHLRNTDHRAIRDAGQREHPRVCGEHMQL